MKSPGRGVTWGVWVVSGQGAGVRWGPQHEALLMSYLVHVTRHNHPVGHAAPSNITAPSGSCQPSLSLLWVYYQQLYFFPISPSWNTSHQRRCITYYMNV